MALHNPNNWHWVNKDVRPWAQDWLSKELVGLKASKEDGTSAEVSKVLSMEGDVDVSQRKGKVITIFDIRLQLEYIGKVPTKGEKKEVEGGEDAEASQEGDTKDVSGTITIPEVAHDTEEDEYVVRVHPAPNIEVIDTVRLTFRLVRSRNLLLRPLQRTRQRSRPKGDHTSNPHPPPETRTHTDSRTRQRHSTHRQLQPFLWRQHAQNTADLVGQHLSAERWERLQNINVSFQHQRHHPL